MRVDGGSVRSMASLMRANTPFQFQSRLNLTLLTGLRARDAAELLQHLRSVPGNVIYHHTHHFLVQHQFLSPEPPNDFAFWVSTILLEERLGEELAAVDVLSFTTIRELREALIRVIEEFLEEASNLRVAPQGEEFHFMQSISFILPTDFMASDLREFRDALEKISLHSISYHMFDARLRLEQGDNDFSKWIESELGEKPLANKLRNIDPYTITEEGLRRRMIAMVDERLTELRHA
jgi:uncharacterized protein DUF5752